MSAPRTIGYVTLCLIFLVLNGCAYTDPHDNFKSFVFNRIGKDIALVKNASRENKQEIVSLPNGNLEYRFTWQFRPSVWGHVYGPCTEIYEVDAATQKIIRADFVGEKTDCFITP